MLVNESENILPSGRFKGFTLIEVIVAMTILAVGILGLMSAFSLCAQTASRGFRLDQAASVAEKQLELAVASPASNLEPITGSVDQYAWTITFAEKSYGLVLASVMVHWTERGVPQAFRLSQVFLLGRQD